MKIGLAHLCIFLLYPLINVQESLPPVFLKLEGKWQRIGKQDNFEHWEQSDNKLIAESYNITDGKKNILERIDIEFSEGSWFFIPDVPHNPAPVSFQITELNDSYFHSQNIEHDFPKWIRYEFKGLDTLNVIIGDNTDSVYFNYIRFP